jgi:hypothetical protein
MDFVLPQYMTKMFVGMIDIRKLKLKSELTDKDCEGNVHLE